MDNKPVRPPLRSEPKPKTLREIEFDLWAYQLDKRIEAYLVQKANQKLLPEPQHG